MLDYEGKLNLLVADTERLNKAYLVKSQEVEVWREKYTRLENARLSEVQDIINQNASLSQQVRESKLTPLIIASSYLVYKIIYESKGLLC